MFNSPFWSTLNTSSFSRTLVILKPLADIFVFEFTLEADTVTPFLSIETIPSYTSFGCGV